MSVRKALAAVIVLGLAVAGCDYIVPPISFDTPTPAVKSQGWAAIVTNVADKAGALHVDLSMVNNTNDWSAMDVAGSTAKVMDSTGKSTTCAKVFVGTSVFVNNGGWYLPPGFVMKGYTAGTVDKPETQLLYVECAGVAAGKGLKLAVDYSYITGPFNYYVASHEFSDTFTLNLDTVVTNTKYPIASKVASLEISKSDASILGINRCTVQLTGVARTATEFDFNWKTLNPTEYPAYVHIGNPPVIGSDGILYGFYESPHLATAPITPNETNGTSGDAEWSTSVSVPNDPTGFYILLPVESQQSKFFIDHVIDITGQSSITGTFPPAPAATASSASAVATATPAS